MMVWQQASKTDASEDAAQHQQKHHAR